MIITLVAGLVIVAVPLYLLGSRPKSELKDAQRSAASADSTSLGGGAPPGDSGNVYTASAQQPPKNPGVVIAEAKMMKCSKGSTKTPVEQCDRQPYFEEALVKAIRDNLSCAPQVSSGGTINFVLDVDHKAKSMKVWGGKSGSIKRNRRKEMLSCVSRAMPTPDWAQIPHQQTKYQVAVMVTLPPSGPSTGPQ